MNKSLNELLNYYIEATDGIKGKIKDFLFDEETWIIRYLEADLGNIFTGNKVLISRRFLGNPQLVSLTFPISLTIEQIEKSPKLEQHLPISRKYEEELNKVFDINAYWEESYPFADGSAFSPPRLKRMESDLVNEKQLGTHLRSFNEIKGYHIKATDGKLGHIKDFIINDNWNIVYAVVDTINWMPWSKEVLISIEQMEEISYLDETITINQDSNTIKEAPDFDFGKFLDENYEKKLQQYYQQAKKQ